MLVGVLPPTYELPEIAAWFERGPHETGHQVTMQPHGSPNRYASDRP
jgi:hypothetical protein